MILEKSGGQGGLDPQGPPGSACVGMQFKFVMYAFLTSRDQRVPRRTLGPPLHPRINRKWPEIAVFGLRLCHVSFSVSRTNFRRTPKLRCPSTDLHERTCRKSVICSQKYVHNLDGNTRRDRATGWNFPELAQQWDRSPSSCSCSVTWPYNWPKVRQGTKVFCCSERIISGIYIPPRECLVWNEVSTSRVLCFVLWVGAWLIFITKVWPLFIEHAKPCSLLSYAKFPLLPDYSSGN